MNRVPPWATAASVNRAAGPTTSSIAPGMSPHRIGRHVPGEVGIWVFIFGDLMVFALFFAVFIFYRGQDLTTYLRGQATLNQAFGAINTVLLLSSSWLVVLALHAARECPERRIATPILALATMCGLCFPFIKIVEYRQKVLAGITPATNDFYMYYFVFTGIHLLHVLIGLVVLGCMWNRSRVTRLATKDIRFLETGASFWHLVDLLWIVLYPLFYLMK